jgi:hypothetical protein
MTNRLRQKKPCRVFLDKYPGKYTNTLNTLINNRKRFYGCLLRMKTVPQKVSNIILRDEDKVQDGNNQSGYMI